MMRWLPLALLGIVLSGCLQSAPSPTTTGLQIGQQAPDFESEDLDGKPVKLSDLRGKVVVLDFWATWCPPCRAMIPHTRKLVEKHQGKPFVFVSISADNSVGTLKDFLADNPMPWTHWYAGPDGQVIQDWNIMYFPTIYVLDAQGIIRAKDVRDKQLDQAVEKLLAAGDKTSS